MPDKRYRYDLSIIVTLNTRGLKSGGEEVEKRLTRFERQAQKAIEQFEKLSRAIEKAEKANSRASSGGGRRGGGVDNAMLKAMADIARMQRQVENGEKALTRQMEREAKAQASAKAREMRRAADAMIHEIDRVNRAESRQYSGRNSLPSGGLLGAIVGGNLLAQGASAALSAITSLLSAAANKAAELGVTSIKLAGDFEVTTNAMTLFEGSARNAQTALERLDKRALSTPGLRIEDAEKGTAALRALNFQMTTAENLAVGLAKQKLISGTNDEGAIQRVLINLQQLRAGSPQVQKDIQQMILSLPSLSTEINKTFGGIEKFKAALAKDPSAAIDKFADALAKAEAPAGGFNDAVDKVTDSLIIAGREFGTPILAPLTEDLKTLSNYLIENGNAWKEWGESTKNVYLGIVSLFQKFDPAEDTFLGNSTRRLMTLIEYTKYIPGSLLGALDDLSKEGERVAALRNRARQSGIIGAKTQEQLDGERSIQRVVDQTQLAIIEQENRAVQRRLEIITTYYNERINIIQANNRLELAAVDAVLTDTVEQEMDVLRRRQAVLENGLREQIKATESYYREQINLNAGNETEQLKLQFEGNQKLRGLTVDLIESQIKLQKDLAEKEKRILEDRRQAQIRFVELDKEIRKSRFDNAIFDIERALERQTVTTEEGYSQLLEITNASFAEQVRLSRESYELQLKDLSLTVEQRENITKQMYFAEEKLAEDNRRAIFDIEDNRYKDQVRRLEQFTQRQKAVFESQASVIRGMAGFFDSSDFDRRSYQAFRNAYMGDNIAKEIDRLIGRRQMAYEAYYKFVTEAKELDSDLYTGDYLKDSGNAAERVRNLDEVIKQNQNTLTEYQRDISDTAKQIDKLGKELATVAGAYRNFDEIAKKSLQDEQDKQMASANLDLLLAESKFKIATARERGNLQYLVDANKNNPDELAKAKEALEEFDKAVADTSGRNVTGFTLDMLEARNAIRLTKDAITNLTASQEQQKLEQYRNSTEGLTEAIKNLSGDDIATQNALTDIFVKGDLREQRDSLIEIRRLEYEIANAPTVDNLAIQKAYLEDILSLRRQETDAIITINHAQLELAQKGTFSAVQANAQFLDFLNQNSKSLSAIYADAKISIVEGFWGSLESRIGKATAKLGLFGDVIKQVLMDLIRLATSKLFTGNINSGGSNGGGGFLQSILGGIFGGNNRQSTTNLINSQGGGANQSISQQIQQTVQQLSTRPRIAQTIGENIPTLTNNAVAMPLQTIGGKPIYSRLNIPAASSVLSPFAKGKFSLSNLGKTLDSLAPMLGLSLGGMAGGQSVGGQILGSAGGLIGGTLLSTLLSGGFTGATASGGIFGSIGGAIGLSGAATAGIALAAVPLLMLGSWLFGRNKQRKADEKTRNTAMGDAFKALDKLISDVNSDKIDGEQALSQAEDIRKNYLDQMGQLKDKKTRRIALADVSRIDAKIATLKSAVAAQGQRKDKMIMLSPTFADGGGVSDFINSNYRNNPLGYVQGPGSSRSDSISAWFPVAGTHARISNREYVLDAETTRNVGIWNLDRLRAGKGRNLGEIARMMNRVHEPRIKLADGGAVSSFSSSGALSGAGSGTGSTIQMKAETHVVIYQSGDGSIETVSAETYLDTPQGKQKIESIVEGKIYENKSSGKIPTAINRVNRGQS